MGGRDGQGGAASLQRYPYIVAVHRDTVARQDQVRVFLTCTCRQIETPAVPGTGQHSTANFSLMEGAMGMRAAGGHGDGRTLYKHHPPIQIGIASCRERVCHYG